MSTKKRRKQQQKRDNFEINSSDAVGMFIAERKRGGKGDKGGTKALKTLLAHWPSPLLSGTWAMACELPCPRDQSAEQGHVIHKTGNRICNMKVYP
jgi:hypothetical protein